MPSAAELQLRTNAMLNWFLSDASASIDGEPTHVKDMFAAQIAASYRTIDTTSIDRVATMIEIEPIDETDYQTEYLAPIIEMRDLVRENLAEDIQDVILHGSLSTLDYVEGWSDVDAIMIVRNSTLGDPTKMRRLRRFMRELGVYMRKIDPLQHHGIMAVTEHDLRMYPDMFLPHQLFENTKTLLGHLELELHVRDSGADQRVRFNAIYETFRSASETGTLKHHPYAGVFLKEDFTNASNAMYQMKYFLSVLLLLPSLYMNLKGVYCTKKQSFTLCRPDLESENWGIIDRASRVRNAYKNTVIKNNAIPEWVQEYVDKKYFSRAFALIEDMRVALDGDDADDTDA